MKRFVDRRTTVPGSAFALICALFLALFSASWAQAAHSGSAAGAAARDTMGMGPSHVGPHKTFLGYYDSHLDTYYSTDVSDKAQAKTLGINFAPGLKHVTEGAAPAIYLAEGSAAPHQLAVFGSQPGEVDYSPLWHEVTVKWKSGSKVVLLTSDNQINALKAKGKLTLTDMHTILNCPIIHVAK
jgi:hypothetical protein